MQERPILFSGPLVRGILDGRKTQTRRLIRYDFGNDTTFPASPAGVHGVYMTRTREFTGRYLTPPAEPGDHLYVRETWSHTGDGVWSPRDALGAMNGKFIYRATDDAPGAGWFPSIHMPKSASRLTLKVTSVRVERLQDITDADAVAEGFGSPCDHRNPAVPGACEDCMNTGHTYPPALAFRETWIELYGAESWDANPWVWVVDFKRLP